MSTAQAMPWLAQYPEGTPPTIDTNEFPSVADVMQLGGGLQQELLVRPQPVQRLHDVE